MFLFGHTGLTIASVILADRGFQLFRTDLKSRTDIKHSLLRYMDCRLLTLGAMLPDIVDKPLGIYLLGGYYGNGRIFAHTLLLTVLVAVGGALAYSKYRYTVIFTIAAGMLFHLIFDSMWEHSSTLFWPVLGIAFPLHVVGTDWADVMWARLFDDPSTYIPEIAGSAVLLCIFVWLVRKKQLWYFIRSGKIVK